MWLSLSSCNSFVPPGMHESWVFYTCHRNLIPTLHGPAILKMAEHVTALKCKIFPTLFIITLPASTSMVEVVSAFHYNPLFPAVKNVLQAQTQHIENKSRRKFSTTFFFKINKLVGAFF